MFIPVKKRKVSSMQQVVTSDIMSRKDKGSDTSSQKCNENVNGPVESTQKKKKIPRRVVQYEGYKVSNDFGRK